MTGQSFHHRITVLLTASRELSAEELAVAMVRLQIDELIKNSIMVEVVEVQPGLL